MFDTDHENAVIVALDHGLHGGPQTGFTDPTATVEAVLAGEPDGVLAGVPFLERYPDQLDDVLTVATLDVLHNSTLPGASEDIEIHERVFSVTDALEADADAIKVAVVYGREAPATLAANLRFAAQAARTANRQGIPAILEPTLWGQRVENRLDPAGLRHVNRIGFELGADILKSPYPGDPSAFAPIVQDAPVPVMIAGGPATETDRAALELVADAMEAGASGVIMGRNIWQRTDVAPMIRAIKAIVHEAVPVQDAMTHLGE